MKPVFKRQSNQSYNGRWERAVWNRFIFCNLKEIQTQSERYVNAVHEKRAKQTNAAPTRWLIDEHWQLDWQTPPQGTVIFIRRTNDLGNVNIMEHTWVLDENWSNKLVRADVDLTKYEIIFYRLRRRDPQNYIYIGTAEYHFPVREFIDD